MSPVSPPLSIPSALSSASSNRKGRDSNPSKATGPVPVAFFFSPPGQPACPVLAAGPCRRSLSPVLAAGSCSRSLPPVPGQSWPGTVSLRSTPPFAPLSVPPLTLPRVARVPATTALEPPQGVYCGGRRTASRLGQQENRWRSAPPTDTRPSAVSSAIAPFLPSMAGPTSPRVPWKADPPSHRILHSGRVAF